MPKIFHLFPSLLRNLKFWEHLYCVSTGKNKSSHTFLRFYLELQDFIIFTTLLGRPPSPPTDWAGSWSSPSCSPCLPLSLCNHCSLCQEGRSSDLTRSKSTFLGVHLCANMRKSARMLYNKYSPFKDMFKCSVIMLGGAELQKDFLRPVSQFSTKKCPKYVFSEFCDNITHKIEQMLFFFSTFFI